MPTVFDIAGATLHNDPNIGTEAIYTSVGGMAQAVRVVVRYDVEHEGLLSIGTQRSTMQIDLLTAEVPTRPIDGAKMRIGNTVFTIRNATRHASGVYWRLDVDSM